MFSKFKLTDLQIIRIYLIRIWLPQWSRVILSNAKWLGLKDEHDDLLENLVEEFDKVSE